MLAEPPVTVVDKVALRRGTREAIRDFGGWAAAQKKHFADGGVFDQIYSTQ